MSNQHPAGGSRPSLVQHFARLLTRRYFWEALVAGVFLALGCLFGGARYGHVVVQGTTAMGTIVDSETTELATRPNDPSSPSQTAYLPVVEFEAKGRTVRFTNWWGRKVSPPNGEAVRVLYDSADPSIAMIDRGFRNWLPWAPLLAAGAFLLFVAVRTWFRTRAR